MITIQQEVLQNLKDAGCDKTAVEDISAALRKNDRCAALRLLERQRPREHQRYSVKVGRRDVFPRRKR